MAKLLSMLPRLLLVCILALLLVPALAQTTIIGRVFDRATGLGLPGATVRLADTDQGTSTDARGRFILPQPAPGGWPQLLRISSLGYEPAVLRVAGPDSVRIGLRLDTTIVDHVPATCQLTVKSVAQLEIRSGLRYAPLGLLATFSNQRYLRLPLALTLGYQTNLRCNQQVLGSLGWTEDLHLASRWRLGLALHYQAIRVVPLGFQFENYRLVGYLRPSHRQRLGLWLGTGYARRRTEGASRGGAGLEAGLSHTFWAGRLQARAGAARWPGAWQLTGETRYYFRRLYAGLQVQHLGRYSELHLFTGIILY
ncbi:carboxypeptidase-like regulatory domain-containing protein [Hymenobacter gummosus]|uniref:Carboxypeptidase-like regulatory domain-containing protein n=1 Tax=Hymenobacter gummosus TaxID=1776032 RepID=A0A431TUB8_9BACT|nr:carboxypeptidase-like regulatory domain-containing protein [Hymenobacter gummosus]RTQ44722.1 carboxypeptidase-like regulatory domain-containing protein [Hymenobacter gummosus]